MKKLFACILCAAFLLSLAACVPAAEPTVPTEQPTAPPTAVTEPATEPETEPTTAPTVPEIDREDYDAYFSVIDPVEVFDDGYRLNLPNTELHVPENYIVETDETEDRLVDAATGEVLFTDPYQVLDNIWDVKYHNNCLFFLAGAEEDTNAIYRLFLPERKLDVLVGDIPADSREDGFRFLYFRVISNCEVAWKYYFPVMEVYGEACWEEPILEGKDGSAVTPKSVYQAHGLDTFEELCEDKLYSHYYPLQLERIIQETEGWYSAEAYYRNTLTGEERMCFTFYHYETNMPVYYPDGTRRPNEEKSNGDLWWLDDYYQTGK